MNRELDDTSDMQRTGLALQAWPAESISGFQDVGDVADLPQPGFPVPGVPSGLDAQNEQVVVDAGSFDALSVDPNSHAAGPQAREQLRDRKIFGREMTVEIDAEA